MLDLPNQLEESAKNLMPKITQAMDILQNQEGCKAAKLCGSGPVCIGVFDSQKNAKLATEKITRMQKNWFVKFCRVSV